MTTIHEWRTPIAVATPLGNGEALALIDYGWNVNSCWVVRLEGSGAVKHFDSDHIRVWGNPMDGRGWDTEIPADWKATMHAHRPPQPVESSPSSEQILPCAS